MCFIFFLDVSVFKQVKMLSCKEIENFYFSIEADACPAIPVNVRGNVLS